MARGSWYPGRQADQLLWWANFGAKIILYGPGSALNLSIQQVQAAEGWASAFAIVVEFADSCKQTNQAVTQWKDDVLSGDSSKQAPSPPVFSIGSQPDVNQGIVKQLFELREQIVVSPKFTEAIGEELGLLGSEINSLANGDAQPELKISTESGYNVRVAGSMHGNAQMRIEWRKSGSAKWELVTFVSNLPAMVTISPTTAGQPESGDLRAIFYQKNNPIGAYSPNYPLTIAL